MSGKELEFRALIAVAIFRSKFKLKTLLGYVWFYFSLVIMKPTIQFIHSYLHLEGCVYLVDIYFQLCLLIFSSESGTLDLRINTKLSWQFPFLFSFLLTHYYYGIESGSLNQQ